MFSAEPTMRERPPIYGNFNAGNSDGLLHAKGTLC